MEEFDNTYTIVKNWPNESEIEINTEALYNHYMAISTLATVDSL